MIRSALTLLLILSFAYTGFASEKRINIQIPSKLSDSSAVMTTVGDVKSLLEESFTGWSVSLNSPGAEIDIHLAVLADMNNPTARVFPSSILNPVHFYKWMSEPSEEGSTLFLSSPSEMGIVYGLYGFLQEKLGFRFYHPKNTYIPENHLWPLPVKFIFEGKPRFNKRGFHLHTMHPMELTEQLHSKDGRNSPAGRKRLHRLAGQKRTECDAVLASAYGGQKNLAGVCKKIRELRQRKRCTHRSSHKPLHPSAEGVSDYEPSEAASAL